MKALIACLLFFIIILSFGLGINILQNARSAIHEIEALILVLIGTVALAGCGVMIPSAKAPSAPQAR